MATVDLNGCSFKDTIYAIVNPIPATPTISFNSPLCLGETLNLNGGSATGHGPTNAGNQNIAARCSRTIDWLAQAAQGPDDEEGDEEDEDCAPSIERNKAASSTPAYTTSGSFSDGSKCHTRLNSQGRCVPS